MACPEGSEPVFMSQAGIEAYPSPEAIRELRRLQFPQLASAGWSCSDCVTHTASLTWVVRCPPGETYLDHAGATLCSQYQVKSACGRMLSCSWGNPHTQGPASKRSANAIRRFRHAVLTHFNAVGKYHVVLTGGCTASLKLLAEVGSETRRMPCQPSASHVTAWCFLCAGVSVGNPLTLRCVAR